MSSQENQGPRFSWIWRLMKTIMTTCHHVHNKELYYIAFDEVASEESSPTML
ncbi:hypothetical protein V6Z12_A06G111600 [Gossypium hirsutum]